MGEKTNIFNKFANWINNQIAVSNEKHAAFTECKEQIDIWPRIIDSIEETANKYNSYSAQRKERIEKAWALEEAGQTPPDSISIEQIYKNFIEIQKKCRGSVDKDQILMKLKSPEKALEIITAPFKNESALIVAEKHRDILHPPKNYEFDKQKYTFIRGFNKLDKLPLKLLPKGFATDLTEFMTTNGVFSGFFSAYMNLAEEREAQHKKNGFRGFSYRETLVDFVKKAPAEERDEILSMMEESYMFKSSISKSNGHYFIAGYLPPTKIQGAIEDKNAMMSTLDKYPFFRTAFGKTRQAHELARYLARGMEPEEYDDMLYQTRLLSGTEFDVDNTIETAQHIINDIAVEALMHKYPDLYKENYRTENSGYGDYQAIGQVCDDRKAIHTCKVHATRIMEIAFSYGKQPEQNLDNDHSL